MRYLIGNDWHSMQETGEFAAYREETELSLPEWLGLIAVGAYSTADSHIELALALYDTTWRAVITSALIMSLLNGKLS